MRLMTIPALCLLGLLPVFALGQARPYTPKPGSFERKLLMDTLRVPVEARLHRPVIFQVQTLRVQNGWAFLAVTPRQPNGKPLNYKGTIYQQAIKHGTFDDAVTALLHKTDSKWRVVTFNIGATDVVYVTWPKQYHAPRALFPLP